MTITSRPRGRQRAWPAIALAALCAASACNKADDGVTISGDVAGLDTIALRGDALIANAGKLPSRIDSLRAVAEGRVRRSPNDAMGAATATPGPSLPGENPMTARAQARGDSMARAAAQRLVSASVGGKSRGDTLRGVVTLLGKEPTQRVVLVDVNGKTITLSGLATTGMAKFAGVELMVRGVLVGPRDVVMTDFIVRAAQGVPAFDGKLSGGVSGAFLQLTDGSGRRPIPVLPAPLHGLNGARVWIALSPGSRTATAYGVIGR